MSSWSLRQHFWSWGPPHWQTTAPRPWPHRLPFQSSATGKLPIPVLLIRLFTASSAFRNTNPRSPRLSGPTCRVEPDGRGRVADADGESKPVKGCEFLLVFSFRCGTTVWNRLPALFTLQLGSMRFCSVLSCQRQVDRFRSEQ